MRVSRRAWIRWPATLFVETFRGSSLLVQLFVLFYVLPQFGLLLDPIVTGILGLGLNAGAYSAEIVRAAIVAVSQGQRDATIALNMPGRLALRRVILPQAVVMMLPPFGNEAVQILKDTSLCSLITIQEISFRGRVLVQNTHRPIETYLLLLLVYFVMAYPIVKGITAMSKRATRNLSIGRGTL